MCNPHKGIRSVPHPRQRYHLCLSILWVALALPWHPVLADSQDGATLHEDSQMLDMSLEDLLNIEVTSVSKRPQSLSDAAAAVFVITNEDLRRSGVTNIPDALRMVPGLQVARVDANKWAVTARGFNGRFANKLLVLMDGRTIYSPSFSGVYWDMQDTVLEDVERIEVIRGPGATVWGANAVNGVINIITRHAADTQEGLLVLGAGSEERAFATGRYGTRLAEGAYGRIYAKALKRDELVNTDASAAGDDWKAMRGGFRIDAQATNRDSLTLEGEIHSEDINQVQQFATLTPPYYAREQSSTDGAGGHLIARWEHAVSSISQWSLQAYYDHFDRDDSFLRERRDTFDLDLTYHTGFGDKHDIVWGLGYRYSMDDFRSSPIISMQPDSRDDQLFSAFIQDEITLVQDRLWLTIGSKFEHNDYTGFEVQPSVRLAWTLDSANKAWASVSRAVRTPARIDHDGVVRGLVVPPLSPGNPFPLPIETAVTGNRDMDSETLTAYELGYRTIPLQNLTLDLAAYYNDYDDLRTFVPAGLEIANPPTHGTLPLMFANGVQGSTYGLELAATWRAIDWLEFDLAYSYSETDIDWDQPTYMAQNTPAPRHQLSLRSGMDLSEELDLDVWLRYTGETDVANISRSVDPIRIKDYFALDVRLAWRPAKNLELSLVGQNLLNKRHLEYIQESFTLPTELQRGVYGRFELKF